MAFQELKLHLKVQQKQILTPGLVQMVSLLALNKLELTEMIQQELVQNPVLEEGTEIVESAEEVPEIREDAPERVTSDENDDTQYTAVNEREITVEQTAD